ncbi:hypothetical protein VTO42DRAFT_445 [Malbranchea cinnamomea]
MACPNHTSICTDVVTFAFSGPAQDGEPSKRSLFIDAQDPSRALNAAQFKLLVRALIAGLRFHRVQRGDCVLVHTRNNVLYPALFLAIVGAGGVYMGSNPASQPFELEHTIDIAEPRIIITCSDALRTVLAVASGKGIEGDRIFLLDELAVGNVIRFLNNPAEPILAPLKGSGGWHMDFMHLLSWGESDWVVINDERTSMRTPAAMFSTSGTGGLPKAAILSHHSLISWHLSVYYEVPYEVSRLIAIPMFHNFSSIWTHFFPIRYGHPLYVLPEFNLSELLKAVFKYQVTETYLVPFMIQTLNQSFLPVNQFLASLRYVGVAGAPIDRESMLKFQSLLQPNACAAQLWGMTEVGIALQNRYSLPHERCDIGSVGKLLPGYEARLVDADTGRTIRDDDCSGQLHIRGPGVLLAYKGSINGRDDDGWFATGDVAYVKRGQYFIVGRNKELIKVRGWQVAPAEIEAVLLKHPKIRDVAVLGVTCPDGSSEVPRAYVVPVSAAAQPKAQEVYEYARERLAGYKALDGGVVLVDHIPRTASGKIRRVELSRMNSQRERMARILAQRI